MKSRKASRAGGWLSSLGGALLALSPFLSWLGVRMPGASAGSSFTLAESLDRLGTRGLLGPGMSWIPLAVAGGLAVMLGGLILARPRLRFPSASAVILGAGAGAFVAYLHGALEYAGGAIAGGSAFPATTPGAGLLLAFAGAALILAGGLLPLVGLRSSDAA